MSETPTTPAAPGSAPATAGTAETPALATPPASDSAPDPAAVQQLAEAQQRASAEAERAAQLQAALDAVNQALNPGGANSQQDPSALAAAVTERDQQLADAAAQLRTAQVELAAYKAAAGQGARADRLLNSRAFLDSVAALDPAAERFGEQLAAAITAAVEADPDLYRATPASPVRGGAEFNGAPGAPRTPATLRDAIAARLGA
ncbi:hypothetical protein Q3V23_18990 [Streptomyces sp. VNUA116]|uniref:hypothetical protein n=1 Tax=Streptomyces sp. VNUA116 TaxID=3062449 RepID=UPI00267496F7|nr:hypothetical protein [Streptomyces sp. VNUA116]WKU45976.1 hypothetical protein Q3V23_18990 [Streptomyces sp. VNUA116]